MQEQAQFGFTFGVAPETIEDPPEIKPPEFSPLVIGEQSFLLPEIEEEAKEKAASAEEEIPWSDYGTQVCLYFNQPQLEEFRELTSKLAANFRTKSQTDTVAEALRRCVVLI